MNARLEAPGGEHRLLAIFAHPDDESILAGGTLAACAASGVKVYLLSVTRGGQGPISSPGLADRATLPSIREQELQAAGEVLGAHAVECLDHPDGELGWVDRAGLEADLSARIRNIRPDTILTFGPEGLYWHPDHIAVHESTMAALERIPPEVAAPAVYGASLPHGLVTDLVSQLKERGVVADLWGLDPNDFGCPEASITLRVDTRPFLSRKLQAIRSHRTQLGPLHLFSVIPDELSERFLGQEYFVTLHPARPRHDILAALGERASGVDGR